MEQAVAAPMCTRVLADFGARVIKVENPNGGDFARDYDDVVNGPGGLAAHFVWCNRGKESVTLNTKSAAGMDSAAPVARPRRRVRVQPRARCDGASGHHCRRSRRSGTPTSSPSRSTDTDPAGRSPTSVPMTFWCRRSRGPARSPVTPACPRNPGPRWPTSRPVSTPRSRSWRCWSVAVAGRRALRHRRSS